MPTLKQKTAFNNMLANVSKGNPETAGQVLSKSGYGKISKQPIRIIKSKGWQELMAQVNDDEIIDKITEILKGDDKRSSLTAADMLLKLKDRYPASKTKIQAYKEESKGLIE